MVSSQVEVKLRKCYEDLQAATLDVNTYEGLQRDMAFDLVTVDAFLAGIISRILDKDTIDEQERAVLRRGLMTGQTWDGLALRKMDLSRVPEMLEYAHKMEDARALCLKAIDD